MAIRIATFRGRRAHVPAQALVAWVRAMSWMVVGARSQARMPVATPTLDLEEHLGALWGSPSPLLDDLATLADAVSDRVREPTLSDCMTSDEGAVWLGYVAPDRPSSVRRGDAFLGGVALSADPTKGTWDVACRVLRLQCTNGAVLPLEGTLGTPVYTRGEDGTSEGSIAEVVEAGFSGGVLAGVTEALRRGAWKPARSLFAALAMLGMQREAAGLPALDRAPSAVEEPTAYGAFNAVTRLARDTMDLGEKARLERLAGRMVAAMSALPVTSASYDLQPVQPV